MDDSALMSLSHVSGVSDSLYNTTDSAQGLGLNLDPRTTHVLFGISVDKQVRMTFDGTDPSATRGHLSPLNQAFILPKQMAAQVRVVSAVLATSASIQMSQLGP